MGASPFPLDNQFDTLSWCRCDCNRSRPGLLASLSLPSQTRPRFSVLLTRLTWFAMAHTNLNLPRASYENNLFKNLCGTSEQWTHWSEADTGAWKFCDILVDSILY